MWWMELTGESQRKVSFSTKFVSRVCLNFSVDGSSSSNCGGNDSRGEICDDIISNLI